MSDNHVHTFIHPETGQTVVQWFGEVDLADEKVYPAGTVVDEKGIPLAEHHPASCSCGSPDCPEWQAAHIDNQ